MAQDSEMNPDDIEEELRDVVFDYENSQALVLAADQYLKGETPSSMSDVGSSASRKSKNSKIQENIRNAATYNPYKRKTAYDRLTDH